MLYFTEDTDEMIIVRRILNFIVYVNIIYYRFWGSVNVAYIPNGKIIGLSKIPRLVDMFAKRLQVQERLTDQIAEAY